MFWFCGPEACGILVPQPGIEPTPMHWKVKSQPLNCQGSPQNLNEVPGWSLGTLKCEKHWNVEQGFYIGVILPLQTTFVNFWRHLSMSGDIPAHHNGGGGALGRGQRYWQVSGKMQDQTLNNKEVSSPTCLSTEVEKSLGLRVFLGKGKIHWDLFSFSVFLAVHLKSLLKHEFIQYAQDNSITRCHFPASGPRRQEGCLPFQSNIKI